MMTGLHGIHILIGIIVLLWLLRRSIGEISRAAITLRSIWSACTGTWSTLSGSTCSRCFTSSDKEIRMSEHTNTLEPIEMAHGHEAVHHHGPRIRREFTS